MTQEMKNDIAEILGIKVGSMEKFPQEIIDSMQTIMENFDAKTDDERKILYDDLNNYWVKGTVLSVLPDVAKNTGIAFSTLEKLDYDTQQEIVYEYMADSSNTEQIYALTNKELAVMELKAVSVLIEVSEEKLNSLPDDIKEYICGMYSMEYDSEGNNSQLIASIKDMVNV